MEIWDIYDEERRKTGRTAVRDATPLSEGEYHLVVHVCIFSADGKMLIQQRAHEKSYGGLWDVTAGGSALAGETSKQAAERELFEEVGIRAALPRPTLTVLFARGFDDVFLLRRDCDPAALVLQKEEVCGVKWATQEEIASLIREGKFVQYREHFIPLLFEMVGKYGAIRGRT